MCSFEKFKETFPSTSTLYDSLAKHEISDKNYEHFANEWKMFEMKNVKDYHDLYLKLNVLLLADLFQNFRNQSINSFELDPAHHFLLVLIGGMQYEGLRVLVSY